MPLKGGDSWLGSLFPSSQAVSGPLGHQSPRVHFLRGPHRAAEPGAPLGKQGQAGREAEGPVPGWHQCPSGPRILASSSEKRPAAPGSTCVPRGRVHTVLAPTARPDSASSLAPPFWGLLHGTSSNTPSLTALPSVCPLCECVHVCVCQCVCACVCECVCVCMTVCAHVCCEWCCVSAHACV